MCGITGIYSFNNKAEVYTESLTKSLLQLNKRGPDAQNTHINTTVALGHARLSILDTSSAGNQPFTDFSGRYTIIYNGEFYNYKDYYNELKADGITFKSTSDTEVLLYLYIKYGKDCLDRINGFFAFAIFDNIEKTLFVTRDRVGIKPLYFHKNQEFLCFASELTALMEFPFARKIHLPALQNYLQLNYIPAPLSILEDVFKLEPGCYLEIANNKVIQERYYKIPFYPENETIKISYEKAQKELQTKLEEAVKLRLISDVPLGTFLSGGIDSSVISTIASKHVTKLKTFSIGFSDNPFFDETKYAELVAKKIKSDHTVISITEKELSENIEEVINSFDEPFADSSAIAVSVLSQEVKPHVTVALSGDGADEIFSGYNKHRAHYNALQKNFKNAVIAGINPLLKFAPKSRNNKLSNIIRKIDKYGKGVKLSPQDAYINWCSFNTENNSCKLLKHKFNTNSLKNSFTNHFSSTPTVNDILYADQNLVLPYDMLTKVDRMSMRHSLEVRTPFLDHNLLKFANSLPSEYKINKTLKKRILQDTYKSTLPIELFNRPKQGFEVPLHYWCTTILQEKIEKYLSKTYIEDQNIFNYSEIQKIKNKLTSNNPEDSASHIWGLIVFQSWWNNHIKNA